MKVIYTTASRIGGVGLAKVANHAVHAAYKAGYLHQAITYGNRQKAVPRHYIRKVWFQPAKIFSSLPSRYYYSMKRIWLDRRAARYIRHHVCDIFHGWTHESLKSIAAAHENGALALVDRGYAHPRHSKRILAEEYEIYGVPRSLEKTPRWLIPYDHLRREQEEALAEFDAADYVLVPSLYCRDTFIAEGFDPKKLIMIPRGFDPSLFQPGPKPDSIFRVIFVGLLAVRKGLKYLLEAWKRLALPKAELLLVGTLHTELKPLLPLYLSRDDIVHLPFTDDPGVQMRTADLFVFPSLDEGSAKVTYEAMACGLPVVVTANAGSVARDGKDGFIVPPRSVEALMEKILYFYEDRKAIREMGETACQFIQKFTWDHYEETLIQTYQRILAKEKTNCPPEAQQTE